jgi:glycosyltransferase involved in cell wall biosynthesis
MRIARLAPLAETVPPNQYGGTERVVSWLTEELVAMGHAVTLFASAGSKTRANLIPVWPRPIRTSRPRPDPVAALAPMLKAVVETASEFDVIHSHLDWIHLPVLGGLGVPFLAECDRSLGFLPNRKLGQRVARFRQVNVNQPNVHHDALEFPNGQVVLVTRLCQGQRATVLQLPASARSARPTTEAYRTISTTLQRSVDRDGASGPEQSEVAHRKVQGTIVYRRNNSQFITAG